MADRVDLSPMIRTSLRPPQGESNGARLRGITTTGRGGEKKRNFPGLKATGELISTATVGPGADTIDTSFDIACNAAAVPEGGESPRPQRARTNDDDDKAHPLPPLPRKVRYNDEEPTAKRQRRGERTSSPSPAAGGGGRGVRAPRDATIANNGTDSALLRALLPSLAPSLPPRLARTLKVDGFGYSGTSTDAGTIFAGTARVSRTRRATASRNVNRTKHDAKVTGDNLPAAVVVLAEPAEVRAIAVAADRSSLSSHNERNTTLAHTRDDVQRQAGQQERGEVGTTAREPARNSGQRSGVATATARMGTRVVAGASAAAEESRESKQLTLWRVRNGEKGEGKGRGKKRLADDVDHDDDKDEEEKGDQRVIDDAKHLERNGTQDVDVESTVSEEAAGWTFSRAGRRIYKEGRNTLNPGETTMAEG